ncbi:MAG TPA: hypothetical protein VI895_12680 [Bdellovibrionota bacterium]|nr:hypothetical protein [Bdellovibrionota bacterium]
MRLSRIAALGVLFACGSVLADANLEQLDRAMNHLKARRYKQAINVAQPLLDHLLLDTVEQIILAHRILGVSQCELGDQTKATEHFRTLLTFSPTETIDDIAVTKPCSNLFGSIKGGKPPAVTATTVTAPPAGPAAAVTAAPPTEPAPASLQVQEAAATETDDAWKRYVPFGVGQFANEQKVKGLAFMSTEIAAFSLSIASIILFNEEKDSSGTFGDPETAAVYRAMFWSSLGAGIGVAAWGIIDAVIVHKRQTQAASISVRPDGVYYTRRF